MSKIVATEFNYYDYCWIYRLDTGEIKKGNPGDSRIPCGLEFTERNQWGANQIFQQPIPKPEEQKMNCKVCRDTGWVHEDDDMRSYDGSKGVGQPCEWCNPCDKDNPPRFLGEVTFERDKGWIN